MTRVSVVVPARDAAATLAATLSALARESPFEVIVSDDGSRDRTRAIARSAGARVVEAPGTGPGAARNAGAALAAGDVLAFVDADCLVAQGWLAAGVRALARHDLVQGRVLPPPGVAVGPWDRSLWVRSDHGLFESANLFVTRTWFDRLGGFEDWLDAPAERFWGAEVAAKGLAEDVWLGWRARRAGARTGFCAEALAWHAVFPRDWREHVAERKRLRWFPAIAARVPELRERFFWRRWWLTRRSAAFDAAAAGLLAATAARRAWPLLAAVPYAHLAWRAAGGFDRPRAQVLAVGVLADAVGAQALVRGSLAARTPLL